jgi:TetR/AcrR family transcriptional regulator, cholesterol catabolism regulator
VRAHRAYRSIDKLVAIDALVEDTTPSEPDTEARIRDAALRLFAARGYAATGIRDVAREAGVTTAALYYYMGGKQDLLLVIMRHGMNGLLAAAREALVDAGGVPAEELASLVRAHVIFIGRNLLDCYVGDTEIRSLDAANRKRIVKLRDQYDELWADVISRGVASGGFEIHDQKLFRLGVTQMVNGVAYWYRPGGEKTLATIADEFAELALAMARYGHCSEATAVVKAPAKRVRQGI